MTDNQNNKLEYSVIDHDSKSQKSFIDKMQKVMDFQKNNPTQIQKSAFYEQDASGKKIFKIQLTDQLFKQCNFYSSKIISCVFTSCTFINCNFMAADLLNVKFNNCTFRDCNFTDALMQDVKAIDCIKANCIFSNVEFTNNVQGFDDTDNNIIQDSIQNTDVSNNQAVYNAVKTALKDWNEVQKMNFELIGQDQNCGLAIYPNRQKNNDQNTDIWQFTFFYGNQSVLMHDFNLYGMTSEQIEELVETWKTRDLIEQSQVIVRNILLIIQGK